ncbi:hypothetical protein QQF64_033977 [Cirrhinus molitorella]|uniref:BED-type domain-containing protein n=1 Tax=Cirrhinus molitorella TaxID=172907 RepID=A0ABR3MVF7_9TELE
MQCKLCLPKTTELAAYKNSTSNLRKHVERRHPSKLKAFSDFVAARTRTLEPLEIQSKQAKISDVIALGANKRVPQAKVDKLMINFICALDDIRCKYRIRGKVVRTTTDSGSNFIKAFSVFGEQSQTEEPESESDQDSSEDTKADYLDTFSILEQDNGFEYQLSPHQRCACHLLNLVATTDAAFAEKNNDTYKQLSCAAFGKCQAMWNKSGWSYMAAEIVEEKCKLQLIRPNQTRWNSTYTAVERIIRTYKRMAKMQSEMSSETNTHMGWLLPVIFQLQAKLSRLETSSKMCLPLIRAVQDGVQKRFGEMMHNPELIAAAILLPKFKNTSTEMGEIIEAGLVYVRQHLDQMAEAAVEQVGPHSSDEEDFFSSMKSRRSQGTGELDGYLACVSDKMDLLNSFPHIRNLSLKLNTGLPASAACERLFSSAGLLFTAKQARMNSANFENQLLLKLNRKSKDELK